MNANMKEVGGYDSSSANAKGTGPDYNPPSYDYATGGEFRCYSAHEHIVNLSFPGSGPSNGKAQPPTMKGRTSSFVPPSPGPVQSPGGGLHHYQHPRSGHIVSTPLPPDHPEMICLQQGEHIRASRFGILGVLAAVFWFPLGIGLCLLDRRVFCKRCGRVIDDGISC